NKQAVSSTTSCTVLEKNFERLRTEIKNDVREKTLIIGQPGSGKSTLLLSLTQNRCIPNPTIGQKTDLTDWSSDINVNLTYNFGNYLLVDSPGYNTKNHKTYTYISSFPFELFDHIIMVVSGKILEADEEVWKCISSYRQDKNVMVVRTFSESLDDRGQDEVISDMQKKFNTEVILVSNRTEGGIDKLRSSIRMKLEE